jgi:hypothetical protein
MFDFAYNLALPTAHLQINEALRSHKRYMHYFERYKQHLDSLTKEKNNKCAAGS